MSKFLKFIVHFVVICTILCVVALAVPPFLGINTVIMDREDNLSNLPLGSVTYAIPEKSEDVKVGTPIMVQKDGKTYRYEISTLDLENGTGTVVDPAGSAKDGPINVAVGEYVPKIVFTMSYIGYLLVATESIEGLIILGLAVLFLVILYVIAELWKKDPEDEEDEDDFQTAHLKSRKELKQEEKERARQMKEEERQIKNESRLSRKEKKQRKKEEKRIIKTGGFVDEIYEEDFEDEEEQNPPVRVQSATSEAHELLKKEIAAATAEEGNPAETAPEMPAEVNNVPEEAAAEKMAVEETPEEKPTEIKKMVIPSWSAAQLADKAKRDGDAPDIVRDEITKVTLFDYSDIISEEDEEE